MYAQTDWQHPYVNVFKKFSHLIEKKGDCGEELDGQVSKRVFRVQGSISANNYLQVPGGAAGAGGSVSLGLTGEFVYIQLRTVGNKFFNVHLDFSV